MLLGNGDGTFQAAVSYIAGSDPYSAAVGDFNGDGKLDLAVANAGSANISIFLGKGDGTFLVAVNYGTGPNPVSVAVGDFNRDGKPDLAVANNGAASGSPYKPLINASVSVLLGNGDGTFQTAVNFDAGLSPFSVVLGDFNGDDQLDLAVANEGGLMWPNQFSRGVSVLLGNGDGTFQPAFNYSAGARPDSVAVSDFNGDGKFDLAVANGGGVSVLLNTCASAGVELAIVRSNSTTAVVSWPFPSTGFVLESTTNLSLTNWQRAVEVPATNNGRLEITVSADPQARYFRLHKP